MASVAAGMVCVTAYTHYTDPEHVRETAQAYLQRYFNGPVTVRSADFSWPGRIRLFDVIVARTPRKTDAVSTSSKAKPVLSDTVFSCREVTLDANLPSIVGGGLQIDSVVAVQPKCFIVRDTRDGTTNLANLLRFDEASPREGEWSLPMIEMRDASVRVVKRDGRRDDIAEDITLTVRGKPRDRNPWMYDVVWQRSGSHIAKGHSQVDLRNGRIQNVQGGLPWMSIEAVMIAINARYDAAGTWSDLLGLGGTVRARDYNLGSDPDKPRSVTVDLEDTSLSIPVNEAEQPLLPQERYLRFDQVYGTITLTTEGVQADFEGQFHGSECKASVTMRAGKGRVSSLDDVGLDVRLFVHQLELPRADPDQSEQEARFVSHWPRLAKFFCDFDPHGRLDVELEASKRAGANEPIVIHRLLATAGGGDGSCRFFPYRLSHLTGSVELTPDGVFLRDLGGEHEGGKAMVNGWLASASGCTEARLHITGSEVPIDQALCDALPPRYRVVCDQFSPQGAVAIDLNLSRPDCGQRQESHWKTDVVATFDDLAANYVKFPYPVQHLQGKIIAGPQQLQLVDIHGRAGKADIHLTGDVTFEKGGTGRVAVTVDGKNVVFDDTLMAALPEKMRSQVEAFHPRGHFDVTTLLFRNTRRDPLGYRSRVRLQGVAVEHPRFAIPVDDVHGNLEITSDRMVVQEVTGRYEQAAISTRGFVDYAGEHHLSQFTVHCAQLELDDRFRRSAPDTFRNALGDWRIEGPIDAEVDLRTAADEPGEPWHIQTKARLSGATVRHPRFPAPFENVVADITTDEQGVRTTGATARYGTASVQVNFDTQSTKETEVGTIVLQARGATLDQSLIGILPQSVQSTFNELMLGGTADLYFDHLDYQRSARDSAPTWSVDGRAELHGTELAGLAEIRDVVGVVTARGMFVDQTEGTTLAGDLRLRGIRILGQPLSAFSSPWAYAHTASGEGRLEFQAVRARIHGGALTGKLAVDTDLQHTRYSISTTIRQMEIGPFLKALQPLEEAKAEPISARGQADARLQLSGVMDDPKSRRGRGRVEIPQGHIYRLPILLAILNVIHLSIPDEDAFEKAEADFFILGDRVELRNISLQGSALALVGRGSMSLSDKELDLNLVNVSPNGWMRVAGLADFVENASRELVELHITGVLSRPIVRARPLPGLREEFKRLFRKKKPKKTRAPTR